jgi:hypothetical protein
MSKLESNGSMGPMGRQSQAMLPAFAAVHGKAINTELNASWAALLQAAAADEPWPSPSRVAVQAADAEQGSRVLQQQQTQKIQMTQDDRYAKEHSKYWDCSKSLPGPKTKTKQMILPELSVQDVQQGALPLRGSEGCMMKNQTLHRHGPCPCPRHPCRHP